MFLFFIFMDWAIIFQEILLYFFPRTILSFDSENRGDFAKEIVVDKNETLVDTKSLELGSWNRGFLF
jgi:hypothetical protein